MPNGPIAIPEKEQKNPHEKGVETFARVYANALALTQLYAVSPRFPTGSIIVREKLTKPADDTPEMLSVMIKLEKGFSPKTNDWEFFILDGPGKKIKERQTAGSCLKCHAEAKPTDLVFKNYLDHVSF